MSQRARRSGSFGVTIREVAARAGVSVATVSRVLNGRPDVGEAVRARVLEATSELRYQPNHAARTLRTRATRVLGLIIADITNSFFTSVARGVEDAAQQAGYSVMLANTDEDLAKEGQYLHVAVAERLAGVVLSPASSAGTSVEVLEDAGIPLVTIDRRLKAAAVDSVTVSNFRSAGEATQHLIDQGCRQVAFIGGSPSITTGSRRLAGYRWALRQAGIAEDDRMITRGDFRVEGGRQAMAMLLDGPRFDGVLIANGLMAIGAMEVLADRGCAVPDDVAVVSFDEEPWAQAYRPSMTVVAQPTYEIGQRAAQLLLERVKESTLPVRQVSLPAVLRIRQSSRRTGGRT